MNGIQIRNKKNYYTITEHKSKHYIASIILFFLYLTKTSMFFLCILLPFVIILIEQAKIHMAHTRSIPALAPGIKLSPT